MFGRHYQHFNPHERKSYREMHVTVVSDEEGRIAGKNELKVREGDKEPILVRAENPAAYVAGSSLILKRTSVEMPRTSDGRAIYHGALDVVQEPEEEELEAEEEEDVAESLHLIAELDPEHEHLARRGLPRQAIGVVMTGDEQGRGKSIRIDRVHGFKLPPSIGYGGDIPEGQLVLLKPTVDEYDDVSWHVEHALGRPDDMQAVTEALALRTGRGLEFPEGPEHEAQLIEADLAALGAEKFMEREATRSHYEYPGGPKAEQVRLVTTFDEYVHGETRLDLRDRPGLQIFGIDPKGARDHDDLVSREVFDDGTIRVGVHIANVDHFAYPGTALDREAELRQMTLYMPDLVVPVYPDVLSGELCSLKPGKTRIAESVIFTFHPDGRKTVWHGSTLVKSQKQFSYEEANRTMEAGTGQYAANIAALVRESERLIEERRARGSFVEDDERGASNKMIEAWMLEANSAVGELLGERGVVFERVHTPPDLNSLIRILTDLRDYSRRKGNSFRHENDPAMFALVDDYEKAKTLPNDDPERVASFERLNAERTSIALYLRARSHAMSAAGGVGYAEKIKDALMKISKAAEYSVKPEARGHSSLQLKPYVHFTSPIRRHPDTWAKRLRDAALTTRPVTYENEVMVAALEESAARANVTGSVIKQSERDLRQVEELHRLVDQGVGTVYANARIRGHAARGRGVLVTLGRSANDRHTFFVPWETLAGTWDPSNEALKRFRPGAALELRFDGADFMRRVANFSIHFAPMQHPKEARRRTTSG